MLCQKLFAHPVVRGAGRLLVKICGLAVWAWFLVWFLEATYFGSVAGGWEFIENHPAPFWYSVLLVFLWLTALAAIFRSVFEAGGLTWAILIIISFINSTKLAAREIPLLPEDFGLAGEAGSMLSFVDMGELLQTLLAVVLILGISFYCGHQWRRRIDGRRTRWLNRGCRVALVVACVVSLVAASAPIRHHDGSRYYVVEWLDNTCFTAWNSAQTYKDTGFILGYLYNLQKYQLSAPTDYSEATIRETINYYDEVKTADEESRTDLADTDYNIIVILNESFYDLSLLSDYYEIVDNATGAAVDLTPNLHRLQSETYHGKMFTVDYGGGTANVEFETLTGLTNYWTNTVPYTDLISSLNSLPSIASFARAAGLETTAMHTYNGGMYKRNLVYPIMGFSNFLDLTTLKNVSFGASSYYADDRSIYQNALDLLSEKSERQMISLVTMQNHTPYGIQNSTSARYRVANPEATGMSEENQLAIVNYAQTLNDSDAYLGELVQQLENSDEKTVVLFYGDHAPGIFEAIVNSDDEEVRRLAYQTPYFIYANFDLGQSTAENLDLGTTSPNCLTAQLYDLLSLEKSSLQYLISAACTETPILTHTFGDDDAIEADYNSTRTLRDYQTATYDLLGGKQYWIKLGGTES